MEVDVDSKPSNRNLPKRKAPKEHQKSENTITNCNIFIDFMALLASIVSQYFEFDKPGTKMPAYNCLSQ